MLGKTLRDGYEPGLLPNRGLVVKMPVFSFAKLIDVETLGSRNEINRGGFRFDKTPPKPYIKPFLPQAMLFLEKVGF